jgi:trehalose 6-phosphate phosphatase
MPPVSTTEIPLPLPAGLPARLATDHKIILFSDYDGTLSEITTDIANAQPLPGVDRLIERLVSRPDRFRVVVISGRQTEKLARLLGVSLGITLVGNHGLEIMEAGGSCRMAVDPALFMPALDAIREWLRVNVPYGAGFVIEDKKFSVALHYRLADPDLALTMRLRLREFVRAHTPALAIGDGKMVIEALPRQANKGAAVRTLMREAGEGRLAVYFGDDTTDEDAFLALRENGVTVKVGAEPVPSWARYRVASPADVTAALAEMASATAREIL